MQPQKKHNIGVYDLYGKGSLTGCGLHENSLVSIFFQHVNPIELLYL